MVAFVVVPPAGVKVAFAASLRWLERSSRCRPLPVRVILTLSVPGLADDHVRGRDPQRLGRLRPVVSLRHQVPADR